MAAVQDVSLSIFNQPDSKVLVQLSWKLVGGGDDISQHATYRELVELIGVDKELGEATTPDQAIHTLADGLVTFDGTHVNYQRGGDFWLDAGILDEDTHPFLPRADEIRARVQLIAASQSNVVVREEIVGPIA
jgi:hypothetical protein